MSGFYLAFALTVTGMVLYHLSQKAIPKEANPFLVVVVAYAVGIALCLLFALVFPGKKSLIETLKGSNWAVFTLGAAAALIELGFLLAYRTGWRISTAAVATNAAAAVMLIPIGLFIFKGAIVLAKPNRPGFLCRGTRARCPPIMFVGKTLRLFARPLRLCGKRFPLRYELGNYSFSEIRSTASITRSICAR